jgi:isopenicillin N synthase-like dioxygenase
MGAVPFQLAMGAMQYKQQGAIGKFNQSVANRNAQVLEGQATQIEQKAEFDIAQFQKDFKKFEGSTTVALAKSGVELGTGTAY